MQLRVLFLCSGNSVESPIAQALLGGLDPVHFEVFSAGIDPRPIHPLTVEMIKEIGIDFEGRSPKLARDFSETRFDFVITLSDRAKSEHPEFPGAELIHWKFDDPVRESDPTKQRRLFRTLKEQIAQRIRLFTLVQTRRISVAGTHAYSAKSA